MVKIVKVNSTLMVARKFRSTFEIFKKSQMADSKMVGY